MAREDLHFRLRIPEYLKAEIQAAAEANARSMTSEIVTRLQGSSNSASNFLTKREHFAGLAMQALCNPDHYSIKEAAILAVAAADVLLAELAKTEGGDT